MRNTEPKTLMKKLAESPENASHHSSFLDAFEAELNMFDSVAKTQPSSPQEKKKLKRMIEQLEIASTAPMSPETIMSESTRSSPRASLLHTINRMINILNKSFDLLNNPTSSVHEVSSTQLGTLYDYIHLAEEIACDARKNDVYLKSNTQTQQLFEQLNAFISSMSSEYIIISRNNQVSQPEHNIEQLKQYQKQLAHFQECASELSSNTSSLASTPENTPRKSVQEQFKPSAPVETSKKKAIPRFTLDLSSLKS